MLVAVVNQMHNLFNSRSIADKADGGKRPIILTGHSLGAALAGLAAYRIRLEGVENIISVVGFGCPKFASRKLAADFEKRINFFQRFVHGADVINRFPPALWLKHCGQREHIGPAFSWHLLLDHRIHKYVEVLKDIDTNEPDRFEVRGLK